MVAIGEFAAAQRAALADSGLATIAAYEQVTAELLLQLGFEPGSIVEWRPEHQGEALGAATIVLALHA